MKPATKTARFELLLPPELKELWGRAAEAEGLDLSSYVRRVVTVAAKRAVKVTSMRQPGSE